MFGSLLGPLIVVSVSSVFAEGGSRRRRRRKWSISSAFNAHNVKCNKATETTKPHHETTMEQEQFAGRTPRGVGRAWFSGKGQAHDIFKQA